VKAEGINVVTIYLSMSKIVDGLAKSSSVKQSVGGRVATFLGGGLYYNCNIVTYISLSLTFVSCTS
jgi:hypothetical protein